MNAQADYLNVFTVEEYENADGQTARSWTKVGVAFPHKEGPGFNVQLRALPTDGKLVLFPPRDEDDKPAAKPAAKDSRRR